MVRRRNSQLKMEETGRKVKVTGMRRKKGIWNHNMNLNLIMTDSDGSYDMLMRQKKSLGSFLNFKLMDDDLKIW